MLSISQLQQTEKVHRGMSFTRRVATSDIEAEWVEIQAAQADPAQFRPLYQRYYESIFRFIYKRTADEVVCGDLCAQVFLKALQKLSTYQFKGVPFSAWLFRIASNEVTQYFRNQQKKRVVSVESRQLEDTIDELDMPRDEAARSAMLSALQDLKPDDLELIELRFFEQRPFKEIATIRNMTESNAKVKTYRILERLKRMIEAKLANL
ncbi:MAG: sigma-70 family RNA polymerase sigma factor [Bacteroidota bacterium]